MTKIRPYDWQQSMIVDPVVQVFQKELTGILAVATGAGKTVASLAIAKELDKTPCVVAPLVTLPSWRQTAADMDIEIHFALNIEKLRTGKTGHLRKQSKSQFLWNLNQDTDILIIDECHGVTGRETQNAAIAKAARQLRRKPPYGEVYQFNLPVLLLSATIADGVLRFQDALGVLLDFHKGYGKSFNWLIQHGCYLDNWGGMSEPKGTGRLKHLEKIHKKIFPKFGIHLGHKDIPNFPENQIITEMVDVKPKELKELSALYDQYEALEHRAKDEAEELDDDDIMCRNKKGQVMLRARQKSEIAKVPSFLEMTKNLLAEGLSVVIFVSFHATFYAVAKGIKEPHAEIIGGQNEKERERNVQLFLQDKVRVVIVQIQAGGVGVSLNDIRGEFPRASLMSPPISVVQMIQALGRIHRANNKSPAIQYLLIARGSVEEKVARRLEMKKENLDALTDKDFWATEE